MNAIGLAVEALAPIVRMEPFEVDNGGLTFREVVTVTGIEGGVAGNVVPAHAAASLNFRYAPGRSRAEAEARLRELAGDVEILSHSRRAGAGDESAARAPACRRRLLPRAQAGLEPVAQFAEHGLDAVNLGPGATRYAHRADEQVEVAELERTFEALTAFALGTV